MTRNRRTLIYVAFALILGARLGARGRARAHSRAGRGDGCKGRGVTVGRTVLGDTLGSASIAAADPAKQQPLLDKFTSKDPFIPLTTPSSGGRREPAADGRARRPTYAAKIKVDGTSYTVVNGDEVPSGAAAFTISSVTSSDVTFAVIERHTLKNGDTRSPSISASPSRRRSTTASPTRSRSSASAARQPAAAAAAAAGASRPAATRSPCLA